MEGSIITELNQAYEICSVIYVETKRLLYAVYLNHKVLCFKNVPTVEYEGLKLLPSLEEYMHCLKEKYQYDDMPISG